MNIRPRKGQIGRRSLSVRLDAGGRPATFSEETRSVEVVAATETTDVSLWDWETGERVTEVLLMSGCKMPASGQIPLLDSHGRASLQDVIGSARDLRVDGQQLLARAVFSAVEEGEKAMAKVREGHVTDVSLGYRVRAYLRVKRGETTTYDGRTWQGPALLATDWEPAELSVCPIGADRNAKARSEGPNEEEPVKITDKIRKLLGRLGLRAEATDEDAARLLELIGVRADAEEAAVAALEERLGQRAEPAGSGQAPVIPAAPAAQPASSAPAAAPAASAPASGVADEIRAVLAAERQRAGEIRAMCRTFGCPDDLAERLVTEGQSLDQARAAVMSQLQARQAGQQAAPGFRAEIGTTEGEKFRAAAVDGLLLRGGRQLEKPSAGAEQLRGYTLRELAREALQRSSQVVPSDPMEMIGRALTSSDLPTILGGGARRVLVESYGAAAETYGVWCDTTGSLPDFKPQTLARISEFGDLDEIPESGEYEAGRLAEATEAVKLATFGKVFVISRQAIINDDLGAIVESPRLMGEAAARKIADLPYAVLIANAKMGDGKALFHADHTNLASPGAKVAVASLSKGFAAMALQKDIAGERRLNIRPSFFLGPVSVMGEVETFFQSEKIRDAAGTELRNIYAGQVLTRAYDARLDDDSLTAWYLLGPKGQTVRLYFLNGNSAPAMESRNGWNRDGVEFKIRIDAAAKALDWKTLYKNPGA